MQVVRLVAATKGAFRTSLTFVISTPSVEYGPDKEGHVYMCQLCACVCISQGSTSGVIPQVLLIPSETGSLSETGPVLTR